ncbi:MAG: EAL domain-containing protein [Acidobacteria bacterium]|nr:EAL domain-containing protein [Acidobacteriota bacterium]
MSENEQRLRRQNQVLVDLAMRQSIHGGNLIAALRDLTEAAAATLDVERVGVWFYTPDRKAIRCVELYERSARIHKSGFELCADQHASYFAALELERTIAAFDARRDPRTSSFSGIYLQPNGITSMLDAPIRRLGIMRGVVCHEQVGMQRWWTQEDESFASSIADLAAAAIDASERREAQESLQRRVDFERLVSNISTHFINIAPEEVDEAIEEALAAIGRFTGADRAHVMQLDETRRLGTMTHEWFGEASGPRKQVMSNIPIAAFPWTYATLESGQNIIVRTLDDMPADAIAERQLHESFGTKSVLAVPMIVNRKLVGFVGINFTRAVGNWSDDAVALLRIVGEIFIGALERMRALRALRASELRHRLLFERNLAGVYNSAPDGRILDCNNALARMLGFDSREELMQYNARDLYVDPEERDRFSEIVRERRSVANLEAQMRGKDGRGVWLLESVHVVTGADGTESFEGTVIDITDRKLAEEALRESESRYRLMAENSTDMITRTNYHGLLLYTSDAVRRHLGFEPGEMIGRSIYDFIIERDHEEVRKSTSQLPATFRYCARRKDGTAVWFETTSRAIVTPETRRVQEIISVSRDITERRAAEERIEYQAYHDALTGLPNRALFRDRLTVALAHARRLESLVAVMFLDLDSFKFVNDTLGHSLGDELLKVIAGRLLAVLREEDTIARMGGDEFTILIGDLRSPDDAAKIAHKLIDAVAQPARIEGHELFITTSIGIALYPNDGDSAEALLKNADNAMYRAKEAGRSSYQMCTAAMNSRALERLSIETSLRRALERDELVLHYQPQVRLDTREVVGHEALLRWNRPGHGLVSPATFIPIAEETRLIVPMGEWVVREACRRAVAMPGIRMAVNLSPREFQHSDLRKMIAAALEESGLDPHLLEIEITESTAMINTERTLTTLRGLREMGVRIAIDDFGTGHSSLNYLRSFPIDSVKIDQAFVHEIDESRGGRAIVSAIIAMAHGLSLRVTAEGVETEAQAAFLAEAGCEEVQGFLFGRPE